MGVDTNKLKELAERAQKLGRWYWNPTVDAYPDMAVDQDFMLAATPQAILGLIAQIEGLERLINGRWREIEEDRDRLKAENEALRKQLEQVHPFKFAGPLEGPDLKCAACGGYHYGLPPNMPCPKTAAIAQDAALEGGGK